MYILKKKKFIYKIYMLYILLIKNKKLKNLKSLKYIKKNIIRTKVFRWSIRNVAARDNT